jgi:hypothetical protein
MIRRFSFVAFASAPKRVVGSASRYLAQSKLHRLVGSPVLHSLSDQPSIRFYKHLRFFYQLESLNSPQTHPLALSEMYAWEECQTAALS